MMRRYRFISVALAGFSTACGTGPSEMGTLPPKRAFARQQVRAPVIDHHQHLLSPAAAQVIGSLGSPATKLNPVDGKALVDMLDKAGIGRAIVLSNAYFFDGLIPFKGNVYAQVKAENDWTAGQVALSPRRLTAFCSFNPLADHATIELRRCARKPEFRGLKLHLGTSGVDLLRPEHVQKVRVVMEAANRLRFPVTVHLAASRAYGRRHSEVFIDQLLPAAPDIPVIIAHLWGGAGYVDEALAAYAEAISTNHPATNNLYFDVAQIAMVEGKSEENLRKIADRMRQIGMSRMLYGSDGPWGNGMPPGEVWKDFQARMPLTQGELRLIASNVLKPVSRGLAVRR